MKCFSDTFITGQSAVKDVKEFPYGIKELLMQSAKALRIYHKGVKLMDDAIKYDCVSVDIRNFKETTISLALKITLFYILSGKY